MKLAIYVAVIGLIAFAAVAGNTLPKPQIISAVHQASVPGPTPTCNPYVKKCENIR